MLTIAARQLGHKRPLLEDWSLTFPPAWADGSEPLTLRELIRRVVTAEVERFRQRQSERSVMRLMTQREIEAEAERGRVLPGEREFEQRVDDGAAIGAAWQAFEDGLYLILIDDEPKRSLDEAIYLTEDSRIVFLRLVMLAGG